MLAEKLHLPAGEFDDLSVPERVRLMPQELGPVYVKLGQIMSSRADILPADWMEELVNEIDYIIKAGMLTC